MAKTILIADDDPEILRVLNLEFTRSGYEVMTARSGAEALDLLRLRRPDFLVVDYQMPDGDGVTVLGKAKAIAPGLPMVVLTAHDSTPLRQKALRLGARAVFAKPFPSATLLAEIRGALGD
jgi:two-component system, NtrC family, response regulator GlrR